MKKYAFIQADGKDIEIHLFVQAPDEATAFRKAAKHWNNPVEILRDFYLAQEITTIETI